MATLSARPDWNMRPIAASSQSAEQINQLSQDGLAIIKTYLNRRYGLDPVVRIGIAIRISERIHHKSGLSRERVQTGDDFMETVARHMRDNRLAT